MTDTNATEAPIPQEAVGAADFFSGEGFYVSQRDAFDDGFVQGRDLLRQRAVDAAAEHDDYKDAADSEARRVDELTDQVRQLIAERDAAREELRVILPMAKGYAAANPVGRNAEKIAEAEALLASAPAADPWRKIETAPKDATEVLVAWPRLKLDENGELTSELTGRYYIGVSSFTGGCWDEPDALNAVGSYFGDDFEYGDPTHWMPVPAGPAAPAPVQEGGAMRHARARGQAMTADLEKMREEINNAMLDRVSGWDFKKLDRLTVRDSADGKDAREELNNAMFAAITAAGFKVVRREPTEKMEEASPNQICTAAEIWQAMWDAAPPLPPVKEEQR